MCSVANLLARPLKPASSVLQRLAVDVTIDPPAMSAAARGLDDVSANDQRNGGANIPCLVSRGGRTSPGCVGLVRSLSGLRGNAARVRSAATNLLMPIEADAEERSFNPDAIPNSRALSVACAKASQHSQGPSRTPGPDQAKAAAPRNRQPVQSACRELIT